MNDIFSRRNFLKSSGFGIGALALGSRAPEAVFAATKDSLKNDSDFDSFARSFMYHIPTRLYFGFGELDNLGKYRLPGKKACVVISGGGAMRRYGYLARTEKQLDQAGVQHVLYDKVFPNPTLNQVMGGIDFAKKNGCDFILGLGGGSTMDSAKAIAFGCTNPGNLWDYSSSMTGGNKERVADPLPIVCITTTAGTGSEIDPWGVITKEQTNEKSGFFSGESMYPVLSIVDPGLTFTVPQDYTAYQGMDAFFHASESVINTKNSQMGEMYALLAITLVAKYLPRAVKNGKDRQARSFVSLANTLAGYYMRCTSAHSLEHAIGGFHPKLPHGAGLIMLAHAYYAFFANRKACEGQMVKMAKAMGMPDARTGQDFIRALDSLLAQCGVSHLRMSDYGITKDELSRYPAIARKIGGGDISADPLQLSDADFLSIYQKSFR